MFAVPRIRILLFLTVVLLFIQNVSALDVSVTPSRIPIIGDVGDTIVEMVILENNENVTVTVIVEYDDLGLTIVPDNITLGPNFSDEMGVIYVIQPNITSGNITFTWVGSVLVASVDVDEVDEEPPLGDVPVEIFPSSPKSGSSIAVFFTGAHKGNSASGFLYCNGFMYPVDMEDGYGLIGLDPEAYGMATLYLFGSSVSEADSIKTFTVGKGESKFLMLSVPKTATVDSGVVATVSFGSEELGNQEIRVTSPSDVVDTFITDNKGRVEFTVDEIGRWRLTTADGGQMATGSIEVDYAVLPLGLIEENPQVGDSITIVTEPEAAVMVTLNSFFMSEYIASSDGFIPISLAEGGRYILDGQLGNMRGKYTFQIPGKAEIVILDSMTRMIVDAFEPYKQYIVEARGPDAKPLADAEAVWISNPYGTQEYLPLDGGKGLWTPLVTGPYTLSVDETASCAEGSEYILIMPVAGEFGWVVGVFIFIIIFFAMFTILLLYSKKRGVPLKIMWNSLRHKKKKSPLPIG